MRRIDTLGYPIVIEDDSNASVASFVHDHGARKVVVLADARISVRAKRIAGAARKHARVTLETFALGERRKTLATVGNVLDRLANSGADRSTLVLGAGGGVASDLFGFAAGIYMRGVAFAPISTTLVGMADAAIGGKTGVDLRQGKNLAGVFRDPVAVFCDLRSLRTLRPRQIREGLAELVKAAIIAGDKSFGRLESLAATPHDQWPWETIVGDAVATKCSIVSDDREERGRREVLNLGHTFGHAFEQASGYRISHGAAVSIGLRAAGLLALRTGRYSAVEHARVVALLQSLRLPLILPELDLGDLMKAMQADKKTRNGDVRFVLPNAIGDVETGVVAQARAVRLVLEALGLPPGPRETL